MVEATRIPGIGPKRARALFEALDLSSVDDLRKADADALAKFWEARPEPGFHDIFGLVKIGRGRIDGDILHLVKNLRFFKEVMALPRAAGELTA